MVYFMLTDILGESTELLCCGNHARETIISAFDLRGDTDKIVLEACELLCSEVHGKFTAFPEHMVRVALRPYRYIQHGRI